MAPPTSRRAPFMRCAQHPSSFEDVAAAVTEATEHETTVYVERGRAGWRWSLAHRGGLYSLLRTTARFLEDDHGKIIVPGRTLPNGYCVWGDLGPNLGAVWAMVTLPRESTGESVTEAISAQFGGSSCSA
jgi:hypothetical protein